MPSSLPNFLREHLIHFSDLHLSCKQRSTLVLLRNLQFYEVQNKQILHFIDLQSSILNKVQHKLESTLPDPEPNGIRSRQYENLGDSIACPSSYPVHGIMFGKYIYQNRADKILYILLKCIDLLLIIKRDSKGFSLRAEYENVHSFEMCRGVGYQVYLKISFLYGEQDVKTNFQENLLSATLTNAGAYRKSLDRIKMKQSELLVHKTITKKEFAKLKSTDNFGCNYLRTPRLEEMQILSKYGDVWIKVTGTDDVVIGVPLVNNCSTRLTIVSNIRAVLHGSKDLSYYKFTLYQLSKRCYDMDSIKSFFDYQQDDDYDDCNWSQCNNFSLRPEAYCVLVLKIKISNLFPFDIQLPLFIFYDVVISRKTFSQKCFLTNLTFSEIFTDDLCRLSFNGKYLNRDLLTVISMSYKTEIRLEYNTNAVEFEDYLLSKLNFFKVACREKRSKAMTVDGQDEEGDFWLDKALFYNKSPDSVWHGTLLSISYTSESCSDIKVYTKTQEKAKLFFRFLHMELKTKVIKELRQDTRNCFQVLIEFEAALRDECRSYLQLCSSSKKNKQSLQKDLHLKELKTDLFLRDVSS